MADRSPAADTVRPGRQPAHPLVVLGTAVVLPGIGQLLNGMTNRALTMLFFMILLGWVTYHTTTPDHSFLGRYAGGLFVYAISILDAYRFARIRWESRRRV